MENITILELNNLFIDTIQKCRLDLLNENDEIIENEILEEFNSGVISFLHEKSLDKLLNEKYINEEIKELSLKLRERFLCLNNEKFNANSIRNDEEWNEIFKLSKLIIDIKNIYDSSNK